jgi:hypothetical protein
MITIIALAIYTALVAYISYYVGKVGNEEDNGEMEYLREKVRELESKIVKVKPAKKAVKKVSKLPTQHKK